MEKKVVIQGKDLSIGYRTGKKEKIVHKHLNFQLLSGELTCLLGANGAGKSTLLRTLSASQPSLSGELRMLDKPASEYTEKERSRTIGVVLTDKTFTEEARMRLSSQSHEFIYAQSSGKSFVRKHYANGA